MPSHRHVSETETDPPLASRVVRNRDVGDGLIRPRYAAGMMVTVPLGRGGWWASYAGLHLWLRHGVCPGLISVASDGAPLCR